MNRYPAEWENQAATWLALPTNKNWDRIKTEINIFYDKLIKIISRFQEVRILDDLKIPYNDVWIRDYGPFFIERSVSRQNYALPKKTKELAILKFEFNAWGEKFPPYNLDNDVPEHIADYLKVDIEEYPWILEGGAMEFNGDGLCLSTNPCLFGKNRNSESERKNFYEDIWKLFGLKDFLAFSRGLDDDHTDGHIDNVARFVAKNRVVIAEGFDKFRDGIEKMLAENYENSAVDVLPLPYLETLPASYMNFIFVNGGLIVPQYLCAQDEIAIAYFKKVFPDREVIGLDCTAPIQEGGSLHCLSKQCPFVG